MTAMAKTISLKDSAFGQDMLEVLAERQLEKVSYCGLDISRSILTLKEHRCENSKRKRYPLVEWGITEAQALQICYDRGFDWDGLYRIYDRCSCWCCPLQRIGELRKLRQHHPELWRRLLDMDRRAIEMYGDTPLGRFKENWTVEKLDQRFAAEERQIEWMGGEVMR